MIDSSRSNSALDQMALVKLFEPAITNTDKEDRAKEIETVSKAGSDQHKAALDFLQEQFSQQALAQKLSLDSQEGKAGELGAADHQSNQAAKKQAANEGKTRDQQAQKLAFADQQSTEKAGEQASTERQSKEALQQEQQATQLSGSQEQSKQQAAILAAGDGVSTEETKKAKIAQQSIGGLATGSLEGEADGEVTTPPYVPPGYVLSEDGKYAVLDVTQNGDGTVSQDPADKPEAGGSLDDGFTHPAVLDPLPPILYPPGFDVDSLFNGNLDANAILTQIALILSETMTDAIEGRIQANQELFQATNTLQQASIQQKTEDQVEQMEKSEQAARAGNCISILVTVLVTILTVVLTVASGFSLGAVIGLGITAVLLVADSVMMAKGETPLSAMIFQPIMEHVIMPVIEGIAGIISDFLQLLGMSEQAADIVGMVLGAIYVVMVIVAMVFLAKNSTMLTQFMSKMGDKLLGAATKAAPQFMTNAGKAMSQTSTKMMGNIYGKMASRAGIEATEEGVAAFMKQTADDLTTAIIVTSSVGAIAGAGAGVAGAVYNKELTLTSAALEKLMHQHLQSSEDLQKLLEYLRTAYEQANDLIKLAIEAEQGQHQTSRNILNNIAKGV